MIGKQKNDFSINKTNNKHSAKPDYVSFQLELRQNLFQVKNKAELIFHQYASAMMRIDQQP